MTSPAGRWKLDVRSRTQRQLAGLPEKIAAAAAGFITGPLLDNPRRVGHPLRDEYAGSIPPAAGLTGACVIGSTRTATRWSSWTFLTGPTPTVHERSTSVAGSWPLYRLIASWSLRVAGSTPERTRTEPPNSARQVPSAETLVCAAPSRMICAPPCLPGRLPRSLSPMSARDVGRSQWALAWPQAVDGRDA